MNCVQRMLGWLKENFFPSQNPLFGVDIYRTADGTLHLFPAAGSGEEGAMHTFPGLTVLAPPYTHEAVGRTILELLEKWKDESVPDGPPEGNFWEDIPGCRSYQSFQRSHQLIVVSVEGKELSMRYMPRDGACGYRSESEAVELRASFALYTPQPTRKLGQAAWQIFRLAEVLDPLPSSAAEVRK